MRFLIEYQPATHDFRIHDAHASEYDTYYPLGLIDRITTYITSKAFYNFEHDPMVKDGDLFCYNNSWWLMIEAKSVQQAINIFWKKMKAYRAKELIKAGAVAG